MDVFTKYPWIKTLKNKKSKIIEKVNKSNCKPNTLWIDQGNALYNKFMQEWLYNDILMCSTHNEDRSVIVERYRRTLKGKIYKNVKVNDRKSYLNYLNKLVDQYNNTFRFYLTDYSALTEKIEANSKASKFKFSDRVRIIEYRNIFSKGYTEN